METFDNGGGGGGGGGQNSSTVFDASQYAFFAGNQVVDEVELGGLEEDSESTASALPFTDEQDEEGGYLQAQTAIKDLGTDITKIELNGYSENRISLDRVASNKNSYATPWIQDDFNGLSGQHVYDNQRTPVRNVWQSELNSSYSHPLEYNRLSSSSPQLPPFPLENISGDPHVGPASFTSYPPMSGDPFLLGFHEHLLNKPYSHETVALSPPNISSRAQMVSSQRENGAGSFPAGNISLFSSSLQQSQSHNGEMNPHFVHQQHNHHPVRPSDGHPVGMQVLSRNSHSYSAPNMLSEFDPMLVAPGWGDQRHKLAQAGRQNSYNSQLRNESVGQRQESRWPLHRSKCMMTCELENILRMQLAATHSDDPYVDDYYHQASLAKKADGARFKRHFCPTNLKEGHPGSRANTETHAFLQVEALGRVPFSSIRRPRPIVDIDTPSPVLSICNVSKGDEKPLEHEPLLAARVIIENGMDLLLDVDDIDRFLQFNQFQDGGAHLKSRRQNLLKEVAVSLHLVGMLSNNFQTAELTSEDELVFLRLVSLPKGQKFLACYIQHLLPSDELLCLVFMAILRHLRFLFDSSSLNPRATETTANLTRVVASSVAGLDLGALGACLAAVVCSSELPQFRPIGSLAGDGASVILTSILQRATDLLTDPRASETCNVADRMQWQASFDNFFAILTAYCMKKYDSIMQTLLMRNSSGPAFLLPDAAGAISKEMPVDLLRASLPHTNEQQRKVLLEFVQRAMPKR